ncbi:MAG: hypothetical protein OZX49_02395 [Immundisolibacter sp.]|nr:hypothetical protein [Immundisolibacter sp.]
MKPPCQVTEPPDTSSTAPLRTITSPSERSVMSPPEVLRSAMPRSMPPTAPDTSASGVPSRASTNTVLLRSMPSRCRGESFSSSPRSSTPTTLRSTGTGTSRRPDTSTRAPGSIWMRTSSRTAPSATNCAPRWALMLTLPPGASTCAPPCRCTLRPVSSMLDAANGASSRAVAESSTGVTAVTLPLPSVSAPPLLATSVSPLAVAPSRANRRTEPFSPTALVALASPS